MTEAPCRPLLVADTIERMESVVGSDADARDVESQNWIAALRVDGVAHDEAVARLYALLLRAARFEIARRRASQPHLRGGDFDDLAMQCAADALLAVLRKLDDFRGESRFTTWATKFALLEAAVTLRRRAWQGREVPLGEQGWETLANRGFSPAATVEHDELLATITAAINEDLSARQRQVLVATILNGVPIDVLAERLSTTRGALYKTLHDARKKLRERLAGEGLTVTIDTEEAG